MMPSLARDTEEEDETLSRIVTNDQEGKWKTKADQLTAEMQPVYARKRAEEIAAGKPLTEFGRVAAQCLHRQVVVVWVEECMHAHGGGFGFTITVEGTRFRSILFFLEVSGKKKKGKKMHPKN